MSEYAGLHVLKSPYHIDNTFDYFIPVHLRDTVKIGDFVTVPFGNSNKREIALVVSLKDFQDNPLIECKPIISLCDNNLSLSDEMLGLCAFMKEHTLCTIGDAVKSIIPSAAITKPYEVYKLTGKKRTEDQKLDAPTLFIYEYILKKECVSLELLKSKFGPATQPAIKKLTASGLILRDFEIRESFKKTKNYYRLIISEEEALSIKDRTDTRFKLRSLTQISVVKAFLAENSNELDEKLLMNNCGATYAQLKALCDKGILERRYREIDRGLEVITPIISDTKTKPITLNDEQSAAFETLKELSDSKEPKAALLYGVTGSGKTSVMMKTIDHVLDSGRGVIVLLPEISLTPQTLGIFCSRYGKRVAIIHSGLSEGERFDTYKRIRNGGADVVIGTRSAVFAPIENLGLIIIDEEQEHTYKSDKSPKYHARDIARYRCAHHRALMLLASATPSFESFYKAQEGIYTLIRLTKRYGGAKLPKTTVVDMRKTGSGGASSPLGNLLCEKLVETKEQGNQSILFINRRGYNNFLSCRSCGKAITCPTCSVSMTYHTFKNSYDKGELRCHWCGKRMPTPTVCPECNSEHLAKMGYGTQRVEQELGDLMPTARILRMDTDTTSTKHAYEELLGTFRSGDADVLLGTQMVTKGHDFPAVTLVGVLLADTSLYLDDYRAAERTFAMLTQVIGRAGRGEKEGEAVIQTSNPDHECIRLACAQDYDAFYKDEIRLRKQLRFPPFCDIALLTLTSPNEKELLRASTILSTRFSELVKEEYNDIPLIAYGPFEAPVYKVENKFRMRMVVKCRLNKKSRALFSALLKEFSKSGAKNLSLSIDLNPSNL